MEKPQTSQKQAYLIPGSIVLSALLFAGAWVIVSLEGREATPKPEAPTQEESTSQLQDTVLPSEGIVLPLQWGGLGRRLTEAGVIDREKFEALYAGRGGLGDAERALAFGEATGELRMTEENAQLLLNLLWAFGLANENPILQEGPMRDPRYGGDAARFASTGGWSLATGKTMDHYGAHPFVPLTPEQQATVERVSQNVYRPCCGNSTYFPDCNHGMAMLGLLELMAANGLQEEAMYEYALQANSYWFPSTYLTLARYFAKEGVAWDEVDARTVLGAEYSGALGFREIQKQVEPVPQQGGSCGV